MIDGDFDITLYVLIAAVSVIFVATVIQIYKDTYK